MKLTTQIGGAYGANGRLPFEIKSKLETVGVTVKHPFAEYAEKDAWPPYDIYVDYFESLGTSNFHVACNEIYGLEGYCNEDMAREIVYAMSKRKPIILLHVPVFEGHIDPHFQDIITRKLKQLIVCDIARLDQTDLRRLVASIGNSSTSYGFTNKENAVISRSVCEHFVNLARQARDKDQHSSQHTPTALANRR